MKAGIAADRSILVNEKMETSVPDVYAAGDCAAFAGVNYALFSVRQLRKARLRAPMQPVTA